MYLKSVELMGFKSFPSKTIIHFERGLTVIIGPNGSGKSNISDAVRWVFGEMSPKVLRGSKMDDIIFGGTKELRASGYARVSLIIDNSEKLADCDYNEIKITRQLFRSGESGYYINDKSVRLKDIYELFLNTGVGREGYSIIGQGRIAELISKKSEDRRGVFEEASGISRFRYRKEEAEKKLSGVHDNLTRIADIISEIESRIEPLGVEAEKARRYLDLYERKKKLEIYSWVNSIENIKKEIDKIIENFEISKFNQENAENLVNKLNEKIDNLYNRTQELNLKYENRRNASFNIEKNISEKNSRIDIFKNDAVKLEAEIKINQDQAEENGRELKKINQEILEKSEIIDEINAEYKELELEIEDIILYLEHLSHQRSEADEGEQIIEREIKELEKFELEERAERDSLYLEFEKNNKYIQSLENILENLEGYPDAVKRVIKSDIAGIHGTIAQIINVDLKYSLAIETALAQNVQNIVVQDEETAKRAINYLKDNNYGRATFYPLNIIKGRIISEKLDNLPGFVNIAGGLIKCDKIYGEVVNYLLGRTIICDNIDNAARAAKIINYAYKIVTLDGQVINAGGSFTGGSVNTRRSSLISSKSEIERLKDKNKDLLNQRENIEKEIENIKVKIAGRVKSLEDLKAGNKKLNEEKEIVNMKINQKRLFLAEIANKRNIETERFENADKQRGNLRAQNERLIRNNREKESEIQNIFVKIKNIKQEIIELKKSGENIEKELAGFELERNNLEKESVDSRNILKEKSAERDIIFRETTRLESLKLQKEKEHDDIINQLWNEYETNLSDAQEFVKNIDIKGAPSLTEVRREIKNLGNVNVNAIEEYKELIERYNFLSEQSEDLYKSVASLEDIIENLENQMKSAFAESMKKINANFKETFAELFDGGTAEIIYTDPENVLESELEIEVQPPGKNVKHISLLSGGEQAFVAIALYFALLKMNPAPFCVLDEIESALDEVNVDRFAAYLKRYAQDTQFIVITHRRGTMEAANRLYGVTMQEKGVSKYLSLDINETKKEFERKVREGGL